MNDQDLIALYQLAMAASIPASRATEVAALFKRVEEALRQAALRESKKGA